MPKQITKGISKKEKTFVTVFSRKEEAASRTDTQI
jgi:hypothetical protein